MNNLQKTVNDISLFGTMASPGVAIGKAFLFSQIDLKSLEENKLPVEDIPGEIRRFSDAIRKSLDQVHALIRSSKDERQDDIASIFQVHVQILSDADFLASIPALISKSGYNMEFILANQIRELERRFSSLDNEIARAKVLDVQDVYYRLLRNALDIEHVRATPLRRMPSSIICVAERLLPSDLALIDIKKIIGIVLESGSALSHVSIIAKSLGIPMLTNAPGVSSLCRSGSLLILDASDGRVILRPSVETVSRFEKKTRGAAQRKCRATSTSCFTNDGVKIRVEANAGSLLDVREAFENGAEGIGLLRSELFYLSRQTAPSIDEETAFYQSVMALCCSKPLTVRLLDIGADKTPSFLSVEQEQNPYLGVRGVRFLLRQPRLMHDHIASIVRACRCRIGPIRMLIPFVSIPREIEETRRVFLDVCKEENVAPDACSIGIMLEIPAAVLNLAELIPLVDFVSIGTNDLVQYSFAACRENGRLDEYRTASLPLLLRLIGMAVRTASDAKKEVTVCGEMASDPDSAACLVGAGIRTLSMQSRAIDAVHAGLSKKSLAECIGLAETAWKGQAQLR